MARYGSSPGAFPPAAEQAHRGDALPPLPLPRTPLLGRARELATARQVLRQPEVGLLTLTGTGGSGKTRLALEVAAGLRAEFPDGVVFVSLAALTDADQVAPAIARALGVADVPGQPTPVVLAHVLVDRELLLVLDNFEHLLGAAPTLADLLLRCPRLKALTTSRAALRLSGEHVLPLPPLAVPPPAATAVDGGLDGLANPVRLLEFAAVELFCQRAAAVDPDFAFDPANAAAVAAICRRLDGLPLAIELAAARAKAFPPQVLIRRLEHRLSVLTGGPRDAPLRQRALRDTIAWSHDLLEPPAQILFRRLAVFAGGCTLEAAEAVCGAADGETVRRQDGETVPSNPSLRLTVLPSVFDGVSALVDSNLLTKSDGPAPNGDPEPRYLMLETIREFGLERLAVSGEAERMGRAHAHYFASLAEEAEPHLAGGQRAHWLPRLGADQNNLRAALQWSFEHDEAAVGLRILGALWLWYWLSFREGRRWATALLALPSAAPPSIPRARALVTAATAAWGEGDSAAVYALSAEAVRLGKEFDEPRLIAHALMAFGASNAHDAAAVAEIFREGLFQATRAGEPWWVAFAYVCHGIVAAQLGEAAVARTQALAAITRFEELNDPFFSAIARLQHGVASFELGEYATARPQFEACLPAFREMRDSKFTLVALIALGHVTRIGGDAAGAAGPYAEALALCRDSGAAGDLPLCLEGLAAAALAVGEPARAARLLGAAQAAHQIGFAPTMPGFAQMYEATAAAVAQALGAETFPPAWTAGHALPIARAIAEAGEVAERTTVPIDAGPAATSSGAPGGLTEREIEVLALLAAGESNRTIAAELSLSVRTVEKHIAHIYDKIDARGRADATMFAARHGLLAESP